MVVVVVQSSVVSDSFWPHGLQHARLPCPSLSLRVCSDSCPLSWWCHPTISCSPFFLLTSVFPSIKVFSSESALLIRWPKNWSFSFSINPSNEYRFPLELNSLTLLSKGLSRVFYNTTVWKHQFFGAQPSLWSNSYLYMTTGKTIALTIWTFVGKVMSLF